MTITFCRKRGSIALAILVLIIVTLTLVGLATVVAKASKLRPRSLPAEDTNSFLLFLRPDIIIASLPEALQNPPSRNGFTAPPKPLSLLPETMAFTNWIVFAESDVVDEGLFNMMRSTNLVDWTIIPNVLYWKPTSGDGFITNKFADLTAPLGNKFYKGVLIAP